ncbi:hypothetical protein KIN20_025936 [Parelaphostrongylus tenuis]|uniref:Folliculin DENN domain-containing protein n=1 Tax=Parelaphostrongylus tenuis TaxID=148309 RepID=A0AAD5MW12_PARTN|nr:hypothetical protein KIN20_025936 [Parelaphostrongylus tenuis]
MEKCVLLLIVAHLCRVSQELIEIEKTFLVATYMIYFPKSENVFVVFIVEVCTSKLYSNEGRATLVQLCLVIDIAEDQFALLLTNSVVAVFENLKQMMWTLRTEILRYCDQVLEGVPTQDMLVMMEMEPADIMELDLAQPNHHEVTLQQLANLKLVAKMLRDKNEADLDLVIKQVITGGQIVVESPDRILAKHLILALSNLLPIGCLKVSIYSETYESKYNFLGGPLDMDIPLDANVLVIRIDADDINQLTSGS